MIEVEVPIRLTIQGPFITQSTAPQGFGVDAAPARERGGERRLTLPGTHLLGKLRQAWEELAGVLEAEDHPFPLGRVDDWLGARSQEDDWAPSGKRLTFDDFVLEGPEPPSRLRYRIRIDRARLAVQEGAYQVIESPFLPGAEPVFVGTARFPVPDQPQADLVLRWLGLGLRWIGQLGAGRGIGFGRLLKVELLTPKVRSLGPVAGVTASVPPARSLALVVRPLAPFCLARRRCSPNLFESGQVIPGAAIKGLIVGRLKRVAKTNPPAYPLLRRHFDQIRVSHAFPSANGTRPVVPPLSLVTGGQTDGFFDAALAGGPFLLGGKAPAFAVDWKDQARAAVEAAFGWPQLERELRVRTSIDPAALRARDEELFAYEMICPGDHRWLARLVLPDLDQSDLTALCHEFSALLQEPLAGLGKTKVRAGTEIVSAPPAGPPLVPIGNHWVLTLQTPALLCDPERLSGSGSESRNLHRAYADAWNDLAGPTGQRLHLVDFFARQSLAGGNYLYRRFQAPSPYRPYLLTDPGSVFVFRSDGASAGLAGLFADWVRDGLPLPSWAVKRFTRHGVSGDRWDNCPFIRENGYGEIVVNLPVHTDPARQPPDPVPCTWLAAPLAEPENADVD